MASRTLVRCRMFLFGGLFYWGLLPLEGSCWRGAVCSSRALQATPSRKIGFFMGISGLLRAGILKGFDDFAPEQHKKNGYRNEPKDRAGHQPAPIRRAAR